MKKRIILFSLFITIVFLTACGNLGNNSINNINLKVTFQPVSNSFYYDQLNEAEIQVFEDVLAMCQTYKGGTIELAEPISPNSWLRIVHTLNYDQEKRFWPLVMLYAFDKDGKLLNEKSNEKTVFKLYVQLNDPTKNEAIKAFRLKFSEEGRLLNEEELIALLQDTTLNEEYYIEKTKQIEEVQQEIIAGMSKDIGQKDAVTYFCNWIKDNMEYNIDMFNTYADSVDITLLTPNEYADASYPNCILQETAVCGGFATILSDLCNQIGIPSYVVIGTVTGNGQTMQHGWVALEIGGTNSIYGPNLCSFDEQNGFLLY